MASGRARDKDHPPTPRVRSARKAEVPDALVPSETAHALPQQRGGFEARESVAAAPETRCALCGRDQSEASQGASATAAGGESHAPCQGLLSRRASCSPPWLPRSNPRQQCLTAQSLT